MLYPTAPEKLPRLVEKLNVASDAEGIPRPTIRRPAGSDEEVLKAVRRHLDGADATDPVGDGFAFAFRGRTYIAVQVTWPDPLRTKDGDRVLFVGNVPVGPDPLAMWQAMFLLTPTP